MLNGINGMRPADQVDQRGAMDDMAVPQCTARSGEAALLRYREYFVDLSEHIGGALLDHGDLVD